MRVNRNAGGLVEHCQEIMKHLSVDYIVLFHHRAVECVASFQHFQHCAVRFVDGLEQLHDVGILFIDHRRQERELGIYIQVVLMEKLMNLMLVKRG